MKEQSLGSRVLSCTSRYLAESVREAARHERVFYILRSTTREIASYQSMREILRKVAVNRRRGHMREQSEQGPVLPVTMDFVLGIIEFMWTVQYVKFMGKLMKRYPGDPNPTFDYNLKQTQGAEPIRSKCRNADVPKMVVHQIKRWS